MATQALPKALNHQGNYMVNVQFDAFYTGTRSKHFKAGTRYSINIQASPFCVGVWSNTQDYMGYQNTDAFFSDWKLVNDYLAGSGISGKALTAKIQGIKSIR